MIHNNYNSPNTTNAVKRIQFQLGDEYQRRLAISFTCKICSQPSQHTMSHHSYTKGLVIIECPSCQQRHLIADNLGWFPGEPRNVVEEICQKQKIEKE